MFSAKKAINCMVIIGLMVAHIPHHISAYNLNGTKWPANKIGALKVYRGDGNTLKRKSVAAHEIGHLLGLNHVNIRALMYDNTSGRYDSYNISTPQQDDINGVNAIY